MRPSLVRRSATIDHVDAWAPRNCIRSATQGRRDLRDASCLCYALGSMAHDTLPHLDVYHRHYVATVEWLLRSVQRGRGGSCGSFSLIRGWSLPYPETTGYLIPTLLDAASRLDREEAREAAHSCGAWLLSIQRSDG